MKRLPALILAAGAVVAAPAFAAPVAVYGANAPVTTYAWDPATRTYVEQEAITYDTPAVTTYSAPVVTAPAPALRYYDTPADDSARYYYAPAATVYNDEIIVTAPRASDDDLITGDVADRIATDPRIDGRIGISTYRGDVSLNGRVATQAQVDRAERDARGADGVRDVDNRLRSSVGNF